MTPLKPSPPWNIISRKRRPINSRLATGYYLSWRADAYWGEMNFSSWRLSKEINNASSLSWGRLGLRGCKEVIQEKTTVALGLRTFLPWGFSFFWKDSSGLFVVTWLILPVVICLSQRLSHACLSINKFIWWNCEWLIKSVMMYVINSYYLDNRGNSRANTCKKASTSEGVHLLD